MLTKIPALISAVILSGCVIHINGEAVAADKAVNETLTLDTYGITSLDAKTGAGSLKIIGVEGIDKITVDAEIHTNEGIDYTFSLEKNGNEAQLIAEHQTRNGMHWTIGHDLRIDLIVKVPPSLAIDVDDGSGEIDIAGLTSALKLEDGSGSVYIDGGSSLIIDDGSGEIDVKNISGDITVDDGSGSTVIKDTGGDIYIKDGSGGIKVLNTSGTVTIDDGSGGIFVQEAGGLVIEESGSGDLEIDKVRGEVKVD
jgi:hypothetical protein